MNMKVLWDGSYCLSFLSEKTRKSNHLQISEQRQHFLLGYFKTWVVVRPVFEPATSRTVVRCSTNRANRRRYKNQVSWFQGFYSFTGFVVSRVLWFHGFRGFTGFVVSWFHGFYGFTGFMVSQVSWCHGFHGFMVSWVSWFRWFRGYKGFMASRVTRFHGFHGFMGFAVSGVS